MDPGMIVTPIVDKVVESLWETTRRQFGYLIHYHRNIENFRNQVEKLESLRNDVQESIDIATRKGEQILNVVKIWIKRVDGIMVKAKRILEEDRVNTNKRVFLGCFPNLTSRCKQSREAQMKTITITELEGDGNNFHGVSFPSPPRGIESMLSKDFVAFETTKSATAKVMEALKEDKINFIGIYGMGGVGKTTLVKEIGKKAKEDQIFDNVVFAVVSQTLDLKRIQDQIASMLGLTFTEQSDWGRAAQLHARLKNEKRILAILDDVWERLDVKDVGIPFGVEHDGCKIVITTRRKQVCSNMGMESKTTEIIQLNVLSEQESWDLFRRNAGDAIDSPTLTDVAKEVARECQGLPVALVTVGRAMRDKNPDGWKEAAKALQKSMPAKIEGVDKDVFKCLKLSYDYLRDEEAKSCFLLCSLFPEDRNIKIEQLVRYGMGLGIFENVDKINEARSRTRSVINDLKASCLLLASYNEEWIKMHDVVRDIAISIGSSKYLVRAGVNLNEWPKVETLKHYIGISLMYNQIPEYPEAWECPNLQMLLMQNNYYIHQPMPEGVFKGMNAIKVLDQSSVGLGSLKLETSFCYLANLRTLIFDEMSISDTTALGEIKTLEILSFADCEFLEPPNAMRHLNNLRLLDLRGCSHSSQIPAIIPPNVISSLSRLEELYLDEATSRWASEGSNKDVPSIAELKSLPRLTVLTMYTKDLSCIPEDFVLPDLEIFKIHIGTSFPNFYRVNPNYLGLRGRRSLNFVKAFLRRTNHLSLRSLEGLSNDLPDLLSDRDSLNVLKTLKVKECDGFEYLINTEEWRIPGQQAQQHQQRGFCDLEKLHLFRLKNFEGLCHGVLLPPDMTLTKLKKLKVVSCSKLLNTFDSLELVLQLQELEILIVKDCEALEHMFEFKLVNELKHIGKGTTGNVILHNLRDVSIYGCNKLKNLFRPAIVRILKKLETLRVYRCDELEEIVAKEEEGQEEGEGAVNKMVFPRLKMMDLDSLSNLNGFCTGSFSFEWPSLEVVYVWTCPKLKTLAAAVAADGTQRTPNLKDSEFQFCPKLSTNLASLDLLHRLQELDIRYCEALECIFDIEIKGPLHDQKELLASFRELVLRDLPELKHIWKGPTGQVILRNLTKVMIQKCNKVKNLFPPAIARQLEQLENLKVEECDELEEIVAKQQEGQEEGEEAANKMMFLRLKTLSLLKLSNLNGFCVGSFPIECPSLEQVQLTECPKMKTFTASVAADGTQSTPKLKTIYVDGVNIDGPDINMALQKRFKEKEAQPAVKMEPRDDPQSSVQGSA